MWHVTFVTAYLYVDAGLGRQAATHRGESQHSRENQLACYDLRHGLLDFTCVTHASSCVLAKSGYAAGRAWETLRT